MSKSGANFTHALLAVLVGNVAYFLLEKHLPLPAQHIGFKTDLGTLVDFCLCLVIFAVIKIFAAQRERSKLPRS
jgi:hypothetical protein